MDERGLRPSGLLGLAALVGVPAYVGMLWWYRSRAGLVPVSWTAGAVLLVLLVLLLIAGRRIRATRSGQATRPMTALGVFRTLRLAQACALSGAVAVGWYLAVAGVSVPDMDAASIREVGLSALVAALAGAGVSAAGLWVQSLCRIDPAQHADSDQERR